jgi:hypothetical protein
LKFIKRKMLYAQLMIYDREEENIKKRAPDGMVKPCRKNLF